MKMKIMKNKYNIYIPSKNRHDSRLTIKALEKMNLKYKVVIEPHQYDNYAKFIKDENILITDFDFPNSSNQLVKTRNWIKKYSISKGEKRHWQLDDNISYFTRLYKNFHRPVLCGSTFRAIDDFVDRYDNIAIAGMNYEFFCISKVKLQPIRLNTRIYSCSLINNEMPYNWRGIYNDDTDICLRALKDGWSTVLFNAFCCAKATTMSVKGGNTDIYQGDGRKKMAESLVKQHPDVTKITWKFGRWHHQVDYRPFKKNKLIFKKDYIKKKGVNNYGMKLIEL